MKRIGAIILLLALLLSPVWRLSAQDAGTRSVFSLGAGSRAISMGGAFSAIGDDPSAIYYNPAALRLNRHTGIMFNHIQLYSGFADASYDFIGFTYPTLSVGAVGLGFMITGTGGIRGFDEYSVELDEFSYREWQMLLGYAFTLPWKYIGTLTLGSSVKILNQRVGEFSDTGTGLDIGLLYRIQRVDGLVFGCNLQDIIGAKTKLVSVSEQLDRTLMLGAGYTHRFANGSGLVLAMQLDMPQRADTDFRFGAEYMFKRYFSLRVGYDSEQITAGIGLGWRGLLFDYGYFSRQEAGSSHSLALGARIGHSLEERLRIREEHRLRQEAKRVQRIFASRVTAHMQAAQAARVEGDLEGALDNLKIALDYDPSNEAAVESLTVIRNEILDDQAARSKDVEQAALIREHFELGLEYYSANEYILARTEWMNVLELDPGNENAREYLVRTEEKLNEQVGLHKVRAGELEKRAQWTAALGEWNIIRMLKPDSREAAGAIERINRQIEAQGRDYQAASERLRRIELFESALEAFGSGRYSEAAEKLREVLRVEPNHEEARMLLRRAERRLVPMTEEEKEEIKRLYIEGMKYFMKENYAKAIEEWKKILEIDPDNGSVMDNISEAEKRLRKAGSSEAN